MDSYNLKLILICIVASIVVSLIVFVLTVVINNKKIPPQQSVNAKDAKVYQAGRDININFDKAKDEAPNQSKRKWLYTLFSGLGTALVVFLLGIFFQSIHPQQSVKSNNSYVQQAGRDINNYQNSNTEVDERKNFQTLIKEAADNSLNDNLRNSCIMQLEKYFWNDNTEYPKVLFNLFNSILYDWSKEPIKTLQKPNYLNYFKRDNITDSLEVIKKVYKEMPKYIQSIHKIFLNLLKQRAREQIPCLRDEWKNLKLHFIMMPRGAVFSNIDFSDIDFSGSSFSSITLKSCNFHNTQFNYSTLMHSKFIDCNIHGIRIKNARCQYMLFENCSMKEKDIPLGHVAMFFNCNLSSAVFNIPKMFLCDFSSNLLVGTDFSKVKELEYVSFKKNVYNEFRKQPEKYMPDINKTVITLALMHNHGYSGGKPTHFWKSSVIKNSSFNDFLEFYDYTIKYDTKEFNRIKEYYCKRYNLISSSNNN